MSSISEDRVSIAEGREEVMGSPPFDTHVMPTADHQREAYEHYGYGCATEVPPGEEELRMRRIEEELRIGAREREAGSVSVRKQGRYTLSIPALAAQFEGIARHEANDYREGTYWRNTFLNTLGHNHEDPPLPSNSERVSNPSYRRAADSCWVLT